MFGGCGRVGCLPSVSARGGGRVACSAVVGGRAGDLPSVSADPPKERAGCPLFRLRV